MNEFQLFDFENHKVRALSLNGKAYFVGKDVAAVLGYAKTAKIFRLLMNLVFTL